MFSAIVILELAVRLAAMGPRLYWRSNWHKLDVLLSAAALTDIVTQARRAACAVGCWKGEESGGGMRGDSMPCQNAYVAPSACGLLTSPLPASTLLL